MASIEQVAQQFVTFYYTTFTTNRVSLGSIYQDHSILTFEGQQVQGISNITQKLTSLPLSSIQPAIDTLDAQPSTPPGSTSSSILIFITGRMTIDNEAQAQRFSQTFQLVALPGGNGYYILNDIFRLNYG